MTSSCTSLSLLQILLYVLKHLPTLSLTFFPGWTWTNCSSTHLKLNFFSLAQNNSASNFLILQTYLSAMISSQSVPLPAILASSLTLWHVFFWTNKLCFQILSFSHPRHPSNPSSSSSFCSHSSCKFPCLQQTWLLQFTLLWHLTI